MTVGTSNIEAIYPLTPVQEGILFHTLYAPGSPLYFQQYTCVVHGGLDIESFQHSWRVVIERHPMLRSLLTWEGRERPLQIVRSRVNPEWRVEEWSADTAEGQAARLEEFLAKDRERGFDFEVAPLMRFALFRTDEGAHHFVWSHHHIVLDGWSLGIVLGEVFQAYESFVTGRQPNLPTPPDYRAFVDWSRRQDASVAEEYWRRHLKDFKHATSLRITRDEPASPWAERHREAAIRLPRIATTQLVDFTRRHRLTLNTVLRGAWAILLSRYGGNDDVVFGTTFAGRPPELDGSLAMVGLFINTLPVRVRVPTDAPVVDWLHEIQQQQVQAVPFETTPLVDVQGWSDVPKGQPLFQTLLVLENVPASTAEDGSLRVTQSRYLQRSNYPLVVLVMPGDELELIILYDADRFDGSLIFRVAGQLARMLEAMAAAPQARVVDLPLFPESEADEILRRWNDTGTEYASELTITRLIEETIRRLPDVQAVTGAGASLSYRELSERADTIAGHLRAHGVAPNVRVAICLDRSPGMVAAILGVLRAGGAHVPIDPNAPAPRREFIIENADAQVLILGPHAISEDLGVAGPTGSVPELRIDADGNLLKSPERLPTDPTAAETPSGPDDLVYVMHTSGSTGRPKGVAVTHRSLVNSTQARTKVYGEHLGAFLLMSPFFFDSSVAGIFWTLAKGGTLVLPEPAMEQDVHHIARLIREHGVTHTLMLPSIYELLLEHAPQGSLRSLRQVVVAGEACSPAVVRRHFDTLPGTLLYNEYGPTEATVWSTVQELRTEHANPEENAAAPRVPIGRPIANTTAFVLDERLRPLPVGVPGELYLGGVGLARGYLGRPDLTAERFISHDLDGYGPVRLYRTGDLARLLPDGSLDLLGRTDYQVKIRGQRIELTEIERVLEEHPAVRAAAVAPSSGDAAPGMLVAYAETSADPSTLRGFLADRLPEIMVPSVIVPLQQLPRGPTGKVDRGALPDPGDALAVETRAFVAPSDETEATLASIWETVLGVERVGVTDNFFELGGDSILSIRIIARANEDGVRVTPRQFFEHPTIAELADLAGRDDP